MLVISRQAHWCSYLSASCSTNNVPCGRFVYSDILISATRDNYSSILIHKDSNLIERARFPWGRFNPLFNYFFTIWKCKNLENSIMTCDNVTSLMSNIHAERFELALFFLLNNHEIISLHILQFGDIIRLNHVQIDISEYNLLISSSRNKFKSFLAFRGSLLSKFQRSQSGRVVLKNSYILIEATLLRKFIDLSESISRAWG